MSPTDRPMTFALTDWVSKKLAEEAARQALDNAKQAHEEAWKALKAAASLVIQREVDPERQKLYKVEFDGKPYLVLVYAEGLAELESVRFITVETPT